MLGANCSIPNPLQAWTQGAVPSKLQAMYLYAAKEQGCLAYKWPVRATSNAPNLLAFALVAIFANMSRVPQLGAARKRLKARTLTAKTPGFFCFSSNSKLLPRFLSIVAPVSHPKASNDPRGMREAKTIHRIISTTKTNRSDSLFSSPTHNLKCVAKLL